MDMQDRFISRKLLIDFFASDERISGTMFRAILDIIDSVPDVNNLEQVVYCKECPMSEPCDINNLRWCVKRGVYVNRYGYCDIGKNKD